MRWNLAVVFFRNSYPEVCFVSHILLLCSFLKTATHYFCWYKEQKTFTKGSFGLLVHCSVHYKSTDVAFGVSTNSNSCSVLGKSLCGWVGSLSLTNISKSKLTTYNQIIPNIQKKKSSLIMWMYLRVPQIMWHLINVI